LFVSFLRLIIRLRSSLAQRKAEITNHFFSILEEALLSLSLLHRLRSENLFLNVSENHFVFLKVERDKIEVKKANRHRTIFNVTNTFRHVPKKLAHFVIEK
jgi:hypothetical protein